MAETPEHHDGGSHEGSHGGSHGGGGGHGRGHGGGGHEEGHEGAPEWLISFADNTALMMGFFVILLAMNMGPKATGAAEDEASSEAAAASGQSAAALDWALGVREAFNNPVDINSNDPRDRFLVMRLRERAGMNGAQDPGPPGEHDKTQSIRPTDYRALSGSVLFEVNAHELSAEARATLERIAEHVRGHRVVIEIRGHASAGEALYGEDLAMRLSYDRAEVVAQALVELGIDWSLLRLIASGDNDRLKPNGLDPAEKRHNQRVEIIVTDEIVPGD